MGEFTIIILHYTLQLNRFFVRFQLTITFDLFRLLAVYRFSTCVKQVSVRATVSNPKLTNIKWSSAFNGVGSRNRNREYGLHDTNMCTKSKSYHRTANTRAVVTFVSMALEYSDCDPRINTIGYIFWIIKKRI